MKATTATGAAKVAIATRLPGAALVSPSGLASAALVVFNDFWLKRHHPGILSGKLSDVGLCVFLPLFVLSAMEWLEAARCWLVGGAGRDRALQSPRSMRIVACLVAGAIS